MKNVRRISGLRRAAWSCLVVAVSGTGCAPYVDQAPIIREAMVEENYEEALSRIQPLDNKSSRLLYLYEKGLILQYQGHFQESSEAFAEAELLNEDLYTRSVSREFAALLLSDNVVQYRGEFYEAALIHYYDLFNYLKRNDTQGAQVECRKLDLLLQTRADSDASGGATDPFLHYLTGMVYQAYGDFGSANVSLRLALAGYEQYADVYGVPTPEHLYCDLAENAAAVNDLEALEKYKELAGCAEPGRLGRDMGTVNLFLECGYAPHRIEVNAVIPFYKDDVIDDDYTDRLYDRYGHPIDGSRKLDYVLRIAIPELVVEPYRYPEAEARVLFEGRTYKAQAQVVENVERQVVDRFEERRGGIILKTIARGLAKYLTKKGVDEKDEVAGWLVNALNVATERADTRGWTTLPQNIRLARLELPEGTHDVEVVLVGASGDPQSVVIPGVRVAAGQVTFVNHRVY